MVIMETFSILFIFALLLSLFIQLWLSNRQTNAVSQNRSSVPAAFAEQISTEQHHKAADYTMAKLAINKIELIYGAILLVAWTLGGGLNWVDTFVRSLAYNEIVTGFSCHFRYYAHFSCYRFTFYSLPHV